MPLHLETQQNYLELARLLIEHDTDIAAQTKDRDSDAPLHLALHGRHWELAWLLIEYEADTTAQTKTGITPLHLASGWGHIELVRLFLEHGANATARNSIWELHCIGRASAFRDMRASHDFSSSTAPMSQPGIK